MCCVSGLSACCARRSRKTPPLLAPRSVPSGSSAGARILLSRQRRPQSSCRSATATSRWSRSVGTLTYPSHGFASSSRPGCPLFPLQLAGTRQRACAGRGVDAPSARVAARVRFAFHASGQRVVGTADFPVGVGARFLGYDRALLLAQRRAIVGGSHGLPPIVGGPQRRDRPNSAARGGDGDLWLESRPCVTTSSPSVSASPGSSEPMSKGAPDLTNASNLGSEEAVAEVTQEEAPGHKPRRRVAWRDSHRDSRSTAATRRERYTSWTRDGLILVGVVMLLTVGIALVFPRHEFSSLAPQSCLEDWNAAANGQARRVVNIEATHLAGTPRQRMWLGEAGGRCVLTYVPDRLGRLWQQSGDSFASRKVTQSSRHYPLVARSITGPNVTVELAAGDDLLRYPDMGSLTSP